MSRKTRSKFRCLYSYIDSFRQSVTVTGVGVILFAVYNQHLFVLPGDTFPDPEEFAVSPVCLVIWLRRYCPL